ncbi:AmmeMemoRadiSam system protein B [bacterium]|nr:AmmeMemoRadiSam system protein B [bacterium]MBU1072924.1 AmmeMemoRadiSam system protein B [bacterium]MBU1674796.1 AmmeMemoRadiSam system protein B [bacterium]
MKHTRTRPAALAGSWYPGEAGVLAAEVKRFVATARQTEAPAGMPVVLLAPHAGYVYSGPVAGRGYGLLAGRTYDRVFVLAPPHRYPIARISFPDVDAYATPLGEVAVDRAVCERLGGCPAFDCQPAAHAQEHAEEIQLPFLQTVLAPVPPVVPLLVPRLSDAQRREAAAALGAWCDGRSLFVISTDLTHFGASYGYVPFRTDIPAKLRRLDMGALDAVLAWDARRLLDYGRDTGITMCGLEAAALVLSLPWPAKPRTALIEYARSGDRDNDFTFSVSYAALLACLDPEDAS